MKKITLSIITGCALLLSSCGSEVKGPSDADIAAQVDAKVNSAKAQMKSNCDNSIMQAAQAKADSMLAKVTKPTTQKVVAVPVPPAPPKAVKTPPPPPKVVKAPPAPPKPKTEKEKVVDRFKKADVKTETKQVQDRFKKEAKPVEQVIKEETQQVKNRFGK